MCVWYAVCSVSVRVDIKPFRKRCPVSHNNVSSIRQDSEYSSWVWKVESYLNRKHFCWVIKNTWAISLRRTFWTSRRLREVKRKLFDGQILFCFVGQGTIKRALSCCVQTAFCLYRAWIKELVLFPLLCRKADKTWSQENALLPLISPTVHLKFPLTLKLRQVLSFPLEY